MLRKQPAGNQDEADGMSVGSSERRFHGQTLEIPENGLSSSIHSHHQHQYPPPPQAQQYGAPMTGYCAPGYYYGPPKDDRDGNTVNYRIVLIVCAAFLTILHISRPQTSIITIDPSTAALRQVGNPNFQMNSLNNVKGDLSGGQQYSMSPEGSLSSGGFPAQGDDYQQNGMSSSSSSSPLAPSSGTMGSSMEQNSPGMMSGQTSPGMMSGQTSPGMMSGQTSPGMMSGQTSPGMIDPSMGQTSSGTMQGMQGSEGGMYGATTSSEMNGGITAENTAEGAYGATTTSGAYGETAGGTMTDGTYSTSATGAYNSFGDASGAEGSTSEATNGAYGEATDGAYGEATATDGAYGEATATDEAYGEATATEGAYGETPPAEEAYGETPPDEGTNGEIPAEGAEMTPEGYLPGTAPGTGNVDLSLAELDNFKDTWDPYEPSDNAVFWHIPKAGGSTVKDVIGTCHRFVMATEFGITDGHENDPEIAVVYPGGGPVGQDRSPFVNVDTTTIAGIERAKQMGFADSGLADAVVTPFIYEADELFTPTAKGRLFTVFRHPIDRAISLFYYIQVADWEPSYRPDLQEWTLEQYATSDVAENNWMTRQLTNQLEGDLNDDHLALAMEVIRRKFMVGLMTQIERTVERFERYFRWTYHVNPPNQEACRERLLQGGSNTNASGNKKEKPQEGSEAYELLRLQNMYDLQLYEYIESLFEEQDEFVQDIPADFRNIDATCCKCYPATFPPEGFTCPLAILN